MLKLADASFGITLVAVLPISIDVISILDG